ncbi:MAG: YceH family protein [Thermoanaerobaculales bacterium]|jgi:uncharacterized protein YceH (UPF0502 family)|nr:YceH family protein [Thermoanaerobaculales bacterium]
MRLPRELDAIEVRILACLLEKERTTPDVYPMTVNALVGACNQKSNRNPVMELTAPEVETVLGRLRADVLVWPEDGARVRKWSHNLDSKWKLDAHAMALMTVLMLRGPQTPGELRSRTERMVGFTTSTEVERVLGELAEGDEPLVVQLARRPGQKESRWIHLLAGEPGEETEVFIPPPRVAGSSDLQDRVDALEARVARLEAALGERTDL